MNSIRYTSRGFLLCSAAMFWAAQPALAQGRRTTGAAGGTTVAPADARLPMLMEGRSSSPRRSAKSASRMFRSRSVSSTRSRSSKAAHRNSSIMRPMCPAFRSTTPDRQAAPRSPCAESRRSGLAPRSASTSTTRRSDRAASTIARRPSRSTSCPTISSDWRSSAGRRARSTEQARLAAC